MIALNIILDIKELNKGLRRLTPKEIVEWVFELKRKTIVTTNFRPYEAAILSVVTKENPGVQIIWCDSGYNTPQTYAHTEDLIEKLNLQVDVFVPKQTAAHRNVVLGFPEINTKAHQLFTEQVKLEPFFRAIKKHQPEIWFSNIRKGQTEFRDSIDILSFSKDGVLKVSPFYHWSDEELDAYLEMHNLPNEFVYFDPTKVENNRECGLHI